MSSVRFPIVAWALLGAACAPENVAKETGAHRGDAPAVDAPAPRLKRLTRPQYDNILMDLFGASLVLPASLEPDERVEGLYAVGAATTSISAYGVEKYESAAYDIARQVMADSALRARWVPCAGDVLDDEACMAEALDDLGRLAWRRPLSGAELDRLVDLSSQAAQALGTFDNGLTFGFAALLMSPHFLYRVELGDSSDAPAGGYDDYEMASRLSFFLWNTAPDDTLLTAAAESKLTDEDSLAGIVAQMIADPRAKNGVQALFTEMLELDNLDALNKDPTVYTYMSDALGPSARTETLSVVTRHVFDDDAPYPELFTTRQTYLDRTLAALYNVPAPSLDGFAPVELPADGGRRGLLGHASFLALHAHASTTSVTRRGIFVREVLLCTVIPEPPANANTAIPEVDEDARTMRERIAVHLEDPTCASCHNITDPIGLGFENFDGLGMWRDAENGATIDASGDLDGAPFADAWEMGAVVAQDRQLGPCLTETFLRYATGSRSADLDALLVDWHAEGFADANFRVLWLLRDVALSPAFRGLAQGE